VGHPYIGTGDKCLPFDIPVLSKHAYFIYYSRTLQIMVYYHKALALNYGVYIRGLGCYILYKPHVCTHIPMQTYTWVHVGMEHSVFLHKAMLWLDLQSLRKATFLLRSCLSLIGCLTSCDSE
jgi:hypothetical protein